MTFLNTLLGFAVLTGPLWLILFPLPVAIWIWVKATKRFERRDAKIVVGLLMFLGVFFTPFADEIAGRICLVHLCTTKAGVKTYHTIELSTEYWDEQGKAKFYGEKNGNFYLEGCRVKYKTGVYSPFFHIDNTGYKRVDARSGQVLEKWRGNGAGKECIRGDQLAKPDSVYFEASAYLPERQTIHFSRA